ncbi:MAG: hypothetical protein GTO63_27080 [Anaerolineae bacterium]|nr:hypothetical protein [Anaerolineae bacterium]NIN98396.1 hypothetical protein [Anaerolineae bacterium]
MLERTGFFRAFRGLQVVQEGVVYSDEVYHLCLLWAQVWDVKRLSHLNDLSAEEWAVPLDAPRRPDYDTVQGYLAEVLERDGAFSDDHPDQVREGGLIDSVQVETFKQWAAAGLFRERVWYVDGHTVEYTGQESIGRTRHGTKHTSVRGVVEYCLFNWAPALSVYRPAESHLNQAVPELISKANAHLPADGQIRIVAFDKEGYDATLLRWFEQQDVIPVTWLKATAPNRRALAAVSATAFVELPEPLTMGKGGKEYRIARLAETAVEIADHRPVRTIVLETNHGRRFGILTHALRPDEGPLEEWRVMTTIAVLEAMRLKQRVENYFRLRRHELNGDAIPTHQVHTATLTEEYDLPKGQSLLLRAQQQVSHYEADMERYQTALEAGQLSKREYHTLYQRAARLRAQNQARTAQRKAELEQVKVDAATGQAQRTYQVKRLDVRKMTLLNLYKAQAYVALKLLAEEMGLDGMGPQRLRREVLAFGDRVEIDPARRVMTVYAQRIPRARPRQAYEWLCYRLTDRPITFTRGGVPYRLEFSW